MAPSNRRSEASAAPRTRRPWRRGCGLVTPLPSADVATWWVRGPSNEKSAGPVSCTHARATMSPPAAAPSSPSANRCCQRICRQRPPLVSFGQRRQTARHAEAVPHGGPGKAGRRGCRGQSRQRARSWAYRDKKRRRGCRDDGAGDSAGDGGGDAKADLVGAAQRFESARSLALCRQRRACPTAERCQRRAADVAEVGKSGSRRPPRLPLVAVLRASATTARSTQR